MDRIRIVYMGTPMFSVGPLRELVNNYDVEMVVTQPDKEVGRKKILTPSKVKEFALERGIKVFQPVKIRQDFKEIIDIKPDLIVTCAYGQIIPKEILECPKYGCINIHASLLPEYRGGAPIHHAVMDGKDKTGITIMYMDEKMDEGDILYQKEIDILDTDNTSIMFDKLSVLGSEMIREFIPKLINGEITPIKQDNSKATYAYNISKEDEKIDFNNNTIDIYNKIRGLSEVPGSYAFLDNKRVKIFNSRIGTKTNGSIGEIIGIYEDGIGVRTKDSEIILTDIQLEGKTRELVKDYLHGVQDKNKLIGKIFN
jgi:methionyl-tRNA formyltransferase